MPIYDDDKTTLRVRKGTKAKAPPVMVFGQDVRSLAIEKGSLLVVIFIGAYLAVAARQCGDEPDDTGDYRDMLERFRDEIQENETRGAFLVSDLKPMEGAFKDFRQLFTLPALAAADIENRRSNVYDTDATAAAMMKQRIAQAKSCMLGFGERKSLKLEPGFRKEAWILFKKEKSARFRNSDLAVDVARLYTQIDFIEKTAAEIEARYNDHFLPQYAHVLAAYGDILDIYFKREYTPEARLVIQEREDAAINYEITMSYNTLAAVVEKREKNIMVLEYEFSLVEDIIKKRIRTLGKAVDVLGKELEDAGRAIDKELKSL
jgi:hypothetical protein